MDGENKTWTELRTEILWGRFPNLAPESNETLPPKICELDIYPTKNGPIVKTPLDMVNKTLTLLKVVKFMDDPTSK